MEGILYLSEIPKFSMKVGGGSSNFVRSAEVRIRDNGKSVGGAGGMEDVGDGIERIISMKEPSSARPSGLRKWKVEEKVENGALRVARSVDKLAYAFESAAID